MSGDIHFLYLSQLRRRRWSEAVSSVAFNCRLFSQCTARHRGSERSKISTKQSDRPAVSLDYRQTALIDRYAEPLFYADLVASSILNCNQLNVVCEAYAYTISPPGSSVWSERRGGGLVKHSIRFTCCRCSLGLTCDFRSHHLFVDLYYSAV